LNEAAVRSQIVLDFLHGAPCLREGIETASERRLGDTPKLRLEGWQVRMFEEHE
jgi:hypothetical protein